MGPRSLRASFIAIMTATGAALRLMKHGLIGNIQFVNIPMAFAMLSGYLAGPIEGLVVGLLCFPVSDMFLGVGPWTAVNSSLAALTGFIWGFLRGCRDRVELFVAAFISELFYDVLSSVALLLINGVQLQAAFMMGFLGLFLPAGGGFLYLVGPVTEVSTSLLVSFLALKVRGVMESI